MPRTFRSLVGPLFFALCVGMLLPGLRVQAEDMLPPSELAVGQLERLSAEKETLDGPFPGLLLTVRDHDPIADSRYRQAYRATCCAYVAHKSSGAGGGITAYSRRFVVHVPDAEALPTAKRVARLLLLLQGEMQSHLRVDHPGRYQTVSVWITRRVERGLSPDTGGEQFKDQIYLYDIFAPRRPIEWAREVAHEYGHFALVPGPIGFTAPEDDANGVLGERLFLKWLWADLHANRLSADALPFLTPDQLDTYIALQVTPLMRRIARDGLDNRQLLKRDVEGMDYAIGFFLYLDSLYGSRQFQDIRACTIPSQSGDFLHSEDFAGGTIRSLTEALDLTLRPGDFASESKSLCTWVYLPKGVYTVTAKGGLQSWEPVSSSLRTKKQTSLAVITSGWHRLLLTATNPHDSDAALHLHRLAK